MYNVAAKFEGKCLNDFIYCGPDLLGSLFGVLLRFWQGLITLCVDAKDMYLMLYVRPEDKPALHFLYRSKKSQEPDVYQCERRIFGECSAPACANDTWTIRLSLWTLMTLLFHYAETQLKLSNVEDFTSLNGHLTRLKF